MNVHDHIFSVIKNTGLKFTDNGNNFSSVWKIHPDVKILVIVAYDVHPKWVHILCNVGTVTDFDAKIPTVLLRLNNSIIGSKFAIDQKYNIVCSSEILIANLSEDNLKRRVTQIVKMVTHFYETVEKENLKLNST